MQFSALFHYAGGHQVIIAAKSTAPPSHLASLLKWQEKIE